MNRFLLSSAVTFFSLTTVISVDAQSVFETPITINNSAEPGLLVTGDFNGDHKADFAYWEGEDQMILHILYSTSDNQYSHIHRPRFVADVKTLKVGDFNNDGKDDLMGLYQKPRTIENPQVVWGVFSVISSGDDVKQVINAEFEYVGEANAEMTVTDFDDDGHLDFIYADFDEYSGTFHTKLYTNYGVPINDMPSFQLMNLEQLDHLGESSGFIYCIDINGDGQKDFVSAVESNSLINIYIANINGYTRSSITTQGLISDLKVFKVDGDIYPDIVVASTFPQALTVYTNDGVGSFTNFTDYATDDFFNFIDYNDYDHDGKEDIVGGGGFLANSSMHVLHNVGNDFEERGPSHTRRESSFGVVFADVDNDGFAEIAELYPSTLNIYRRVDDFFGIDDNEILGDENILGKIADFNGEGLLDLASTSADNYVSVRYGRGDGTFSDPTIVKTLKDINANSIDVGDFNEDGKADIVYTGSAVGDEIIGETSIILSGNGTLVPKLIVPQGIENVAVGDFNHDGHLDIFGQGMVLKGKGNGDFDQQDINVPANITNNAVGDFNGDGLDDVLVVNSFTYIALNTGTDEIFTEFSSIDGLGDAFNCLAGDINDDGKIDFMVGTASTTRFSLAINNGDGTFTNKTIVIDKGFFGYLPALKDINNDGHTDLVFPYSNNVDLSGVLIYLQNETGDFEKQDPISINDPFPKTSGVLYIDDLNLDHKPDILLINNGVSGITVLPSKSEPTTAPGITVTDVTSTTVKIFVTAGNGNGRLLLTRKSNALAEVPVDNQINVDGAIGLIVGNQTFTDLEPNTDYIMTAYEYFLRGDDIDYLTSKHGEVSFKTLPEPNVVAGLEDIQTQVKIYPNPAKETVNIDFGGLNVNSEAISFIDLLGRRQQLVRKNTTVDISQLSRGQYVVEVQTGDGVVRKKLMVE